MKRSFRTGSLLVLVAVAFPLLAQTDTFPIPIPQGALEARLVYSVPSPSTHYYFESHWDTNCTQIHNPPPSVGGPQPYNITLAYNDQTLANASGTIQADTYVSVSAGACPYLTSPPQFPTKPPDILGTSVRHQKIANIASQTTTGPIELTLTVTGLTDWGVGYREKPDIFVDIDGTFSPIDPKDDYGKFIPGSNPSGSSVDPLTMTLGGQQILLHIISAPDDQGSYTCTIDSQSVTRFPGIAMNYPLDGSANTLADLSFGNDSSSEQLQRTVWADPSGHTIVPLYIRDYAAYGRVTIKYSVGGVTKKIMDREFPKNTNGNRMPDRGWKAENAWVENTGLAADADEDDTPTVQAGLWPQGLNGDGLSNFEEYRGFVVRGTHHRTNPFKKDLFLQIDPKLRSLDGLAVTLPVAIHVVNANEVVPEGQTTATTDPLKPVINPLSAGIPGTSTQRAVRVRYQANPGTVRDLDGTVYSQSALFSGFTFVDGMSPSFVDKATQITIPASTVETPNNTIVCEFYPKAFENEIWVGPDNVSQSTHNLRGKVVPLCDDHVTDNCDNMTPDGLFRLGGPPSANVLAVPEGDDAYAIDARLCPVPDGVQDPFALVLSSEADPQRSSTVAHEIGHSVNMKHQVSCDDIMAVGLLLPSPSVYSETDLNALRLHAKF